MSRSAKAGARAGRLPRGARSVAVLVVAISGFALAAVAGLAVAKSFTLGTASNVSVGGKKEAIVVNSKGLTVYWLSGETISHPLCTSSMCFGFWPPVTVKSAHTKLTAAPGVKGKLGIWHRKGFFQVTLGGHPLYLFQLDMNKRGSAKGEGIMGFGGTWHVIQASTKKKAANGPGQSTSTSGTSTGTGPGTTSSTTSTTTSTTSSCAYPPCYGY